MSLIEQDLEFIFCNAINEDKFDCDETKASSNISMVDFIIEYNDCYRFIEIKDVDNPNVCNQQAFIEKLKSNKLIQHLAQKYRDSLFFHNHTGKLNKKLEYIVVIAFDKLDDALLLNKQDELLKTIPIKHSKWTKSSADKCAILKLNRWKKCFGENSVKRLSEQTN